MAENFNRLNRAHERYRHTDDGQTDVWTKANSEREREGTRTLYYYGRPIII